MRTQITINERIWFKDETEVVVKGKWNRDGSVTFKAFPTCFGIPDGDMGCTVQGTEIAEGTEMVGFGNEEAFFGKMFPVKDLLVIID